jgi:hypothetical protein
MFIEIKSYCPESREKDTIVINLKSITKCKWVDHNTVIYFSDGTKEIVLHEDSLELLNFLEIRN